MVIAFAGAMRKGRMPESEWTDGLLFSFELAAVVNRKVRMGVRVRDATESPSAHPCCFGDACIRDRRGERQVL
jgi:hypothetical protein